MKSRHSGDTLVHACIIVVNTHKTCGVDVRQSEQVDQRLCRIEHAIASEQ